MAYRSERDVQSVGSDRGQAGGGDVTDTRAAPSKATTAFVQAMAFVSFIDRDNQLLRVFPLSPTVWRACLDYMAPRAATAGRGNTLPGQYRRLMARHSPNGRYLCPRGRRQRDFIERTADKHVLLRTRRAHAAACGRQGSWWSHRSHESLRPAVISCGSLGTEQVPTSCDSGAPADGRRRHRTPAPASPRHRGADHDYRRPARSVHPCWGLGRLPRQVLGNRSTGSCGSAINLPHEEPLGPASKPASTTTISHHHK